MKALGRQAQRGRDRIAEEEAKKEHEEYLKWFESLSEEEKEKHLAKKEASSKKSEACPPNTRTYECNGRTLRFKRRTQRDFKNDERK